MIKKEIEALKLELHNPQLLAERERLEKEWDEFEKYLEDFTKYISIEQFFDDLHYEKLLSTQCDEGRFPFCT